MRKNLWSSIEKISTGPCASPSSTDCSPTPTNTFFANGFSRSSLIEGS